MISLFEGDGGNFKLQLSKPIEILKLDSFLLLDGSDRVEILESSGVLTVEFFTRLPIEKRKITFDYPYYVCKTPYLGHGFFGCAYEREAPPLHSLVRYEQSELMDRYNSIRPYTVQHYGLFLQSLNIVLEIITKSYTFSDSYLHRSQVAKYKQDQSSTKL